MFISIISKCLCVGVQTSQTESREEEVVQWHCALFNKTWHLLHQNNEHVWVHVFIYNMLCLCLWKCVCCDVYSAASAGLLSTHWHNLDTDLHSSVFISANRVKTSRDVNNGNPHLLHFLPVTDASACTLRGADVNNTRHCLMCDN